MVVFLEQAREVATSTKVLLSSYGEQSDLKLTCKKCGQTGHKKFECTRTVKINAASASKADSDDSSEVGEANKNKEET